MIPIIMVIVILMICFLFAGAMVMPTITMLLMKMEKMKHYEEAMPVKILRTTQRTPDPHDSSF